MGILQCIKDWWKPTLKPKVEVVFRHHPIPPHRDSVWSGEGSLTQTQILYHLQYGDMTRAQLDAVLDVTTAGVLLPKMVERGEIIRVPGKRPYLYRLSSTPGHLSSLIRS